MGRDEPPPASRPPGRRPAVLAVDGGDSKTDVALVSREGRILGTARRPGSSHAGLGRDPAASVLEGAIRAACAEAGIDAEGGPAAPLGVYCLAGADLPVDDRRIERALMARGWTSRTLVRNDTFAVIRAGTDRGWGVGVVCGSGMNCAGVGPDGRTVRFAALGEISGDWASGGGWLGRTALGAAVRARDGRGPRTELERTVPDHFGLSRPGEVVEAVYLGRIDEERLVELPPVVFGAARAGDGVARGLLEVLADEIVAMAVATIRRLGVASRDVEVILGGGLFRANDDDFLDRIVSGIATVAPRAAVKRLESPPILGATLIGLDEYGADERAASRLRAALTHERMASARSNGGAAVGR